MDILCCRVELPSSCILPLVMTCHMVCHREGCEEVAESYVCSQCCCASYCSDNCHLQDWSHHNGFCTEFVHGISLLADHGIGFGYYKKVGQVLM